MKNYKYIFFDLDGTLLDTLNDIVYAINKTMEQFSYDLRFDYESGKYLIGSGAKILVQRALSSLNLNEEQINQFYEAYLPNYLVLATIELYVDCLLNEKMYDDAYKWTIELLKKDKEFKTNKKYIYSRFLLDYYISNDDK